MKTQLKPFAAVLCLASIMAVPTMTTFAQTSGSEPEVAHGTSGHPVGIVKARQVKKVHRRSIHNPAHVAEAIQDARTSSPIDTPAPTNNLTGRDLVKIISEQQDYLPFDLDVPGQAFVSTGPYVGIPFQYAGTDLIVNSPSVNTDIQLLTIRKNIIKQLRAMNGELYKEPNHSHLLLSGLVEAQAGYTKMGGQKGRSDIDLTTVSIDASFFGPSDWTLGFIELDYDNSAPIDSIFTSRSNYRVANSRVFLNKAFITFGNFTCTPFYGTVGQFYVPFGTYSSVMVSAPLTKFLGRTKERAILVGVAPLEPNSFYAAGYFFRGDSHLGSDSHINNGGINAGFKYDVGFMSGNIGGGYIGNIADSGGMQLGTGFDKIERISHRVPAYNVRATASIGSHIDLIGEFVAATKAFSTVDMTYDGHGAKPWAYDVEGAYTFSVFDKPSSIGLGYSKSKEALAMGIPLNRTYLVFNTSLFRNTLQSLEFRRDREYAASVIGTGPELIAVTQSGKSDYAVTGQFDYYF